MKKKSLATLLAMLMAFTLFTGCGSNTQGTPGGTAAGNEPASNEEPAANAETPETPAGSEGAANQETAGGEGGTLRLAATMEPRGWLSTDIMTTDEALYVNFFLEPLGKFDKDGQIQPFLAEEFIQDADALTLTIKVRQGIKFSDGSDLNAEVVAWNLQYYQDVKGSLGDIKSFEAVDHDTVVVTFNQWNNSFLRNIGGGIMSKKAFDELGEDGFQKNPVGTGPFLFDSWDAGEGFTLVKNDNYWGEGPYVDRVEVRFITDYQAIVSAFQAGELDVIQPGDVAHVEMLSNAGYQIISENPAIGGIIRGLAFNTVDEGPLQDVRVRQAICHAMNREAIVQAISGGLYQTTDQYSAQSFWSYAKGLETYQYDLAKCQDLLEEAGYGDGCPVVLTYNPNDTPLATITQGLLEEAGFIVTMNSLEFSAFDQAVVGGGGWDGIILWTSGSDPAVSAFANQFGEGAWFFSSSIAPVQEIKDEIVKAGTMANQDDIKAATDKLEKLICVDHVLVCPLFQLSTFYFAQDYVKDFNIGIESVVQSTPELVKIVK